MLDLYCPTNVWNRVTHPTLMDTVFHKYKLMLSSMKRFSSILNINLLLGYFFCSVIVKPVTRGLHTSVQHSTLLQFGIP